MKRAIIVFVISAMVIFTTGLWILSSKSMKPYDIVSLGVIILVVAFALFLGFRRFVSAKAGEPSEDEMSKKVLLKTAALSYYISLYLWVAMLFIKDHLNLDSEELIGAGILGMAISFAGCWLFYNFRGIKNE